MNSSLGVSRGSLFDDNDYDPSGLKIIEKIMKQNSVPKKKRSATKAPTSSMSDQKIHEPIKTGETNESAVMTRTKSTQSLIVSSSERKPRERTPSILGNEDKKSQAAPSSSSSSSTSNKKEIRSSFPADIINISKKIKGLEELLQPFRSLKFKFGAFVELQQNVQTPSSTLLNSFTKRLTRNSDKEQTPVFIETKCLIILFDDIICICSEKKLEIQFPIVETWMQVEYPMGDNIQRYPFYIKTPERVVTCYLDHESKVNALSKVWDITLRACLDKDKKYVGDFRRLLSYEFKSGESYEGEWKDALYSGKGNQRFPSGECYEGYFLNGKRNGFGTLYLPNKQRYDGYWKAGQKHGKGTLYYSSSDLIATKYVGLWKEDQQHGEGQLYLKNGNILKTIWKFASPCYPATLFIDESTSRYIGDLNDQFLREGFGVYIYSNEDRYYGHWSNDERSGKGFYVTSKETEYHGKYSNRIFYCNNNKFLTKNKR